eukprot:GHRR01001803.1.p1 GENE.GHRR01001803.1~~GHRR01001803.1.p1  ORF type:complete len:350 (+),score=128.99 GHRR01001803.1:229-1278(+)
MLGNSHLLTQPGMRQACFQPVAQRHVGIVRNRARTFKCRAEKGDKPSKTKQDEYVEALKKGGVDQSTARKILDTWKQAGAESNPNQLRKLFLRQSLVPITASVIQLLVDAAAAYSIFLSAGFFALGPPFYARDFVVLLLDLLALYFATGCLFDLVTLTSVLISAAKLGTAPDRFYEAVKAIASPPGSSNEGLTVIQKAKAAVSAVKVAQALDAIAGMLESSVASNQASAAANSKGAAGRSIDTLTNLSAYLTLYRAEYQGGFDPSSVGMSESEAADLALKFGMVRGLFDLSYSSSSGSSSTSRRCQYSKQFALRHGAWLNDARAAGSSPYIGIACSLPHWCCCVQHQQL